jgi:tetratricopeptide (TPR) repeat protein
MTINFLTWFMAIALVATIGLGAMIWAYKGAGSVAVLFKEPLNPSPIPTDAGNGVAELFQQGIEAYQSGVYRRAVDHFSVVIQKDDTFAEAYHNRGLALANLRQDAEAVRNLMKAGDLYLEQGNQDAIVLLKQHLEVMKGSTR